MANEEQLKILKQGVMKWNRWKEEWLTAVDLIGADLRGTDLSGADLSGANFLGADLRGADLRGSALRGSSLRGVHLRSMAFRGAALRGADLEGAILSGADLSGGDLTGSDLRDADLSASDLSGANLLRAKLMRTKLSGANLSRANLRGVILQGADLSGADLRDASLKEALLYRTNFERATLNGAEFTGAKVGETVFRANDLSTAKGLGNVHHHGPSHIGLDTIYQSKAKIPESFVRGCGMPESFITQMHALVGAEDGIQFYSCFISYSGQDEAFARRLHGRMREAHLRVWFALEDIQGGKKLLEQLEEAIRVYDKLLIVLSAASLQSEWVMDELRKGFKAQRESGKRKLFPVRLTDYATLQGWECRDSASGQDLAEELRQYFIPDFSHWKEHDQFEAAFARLLKDLQA